MHAPTPEEFNKGCEQFEKHEKRDAMYMIATFLVSNFWGNFSDMANGLGVLLLTWNQAFYRYGSFDFDKLEKCIDKNFCKVENFKNRDILTLSNSDEKDIKHLFISFLKALQIDSGKIKGRKSPVAVSKALHLLAPSFFPLWDDKIARAYGCYYHVDPSGKYILFCRIIKSIADIIQDYTRTKNKTLIKLIDEYNYSKFTQGWI